ncbi:1-deoxy-D-xylulose-5-phosphate synthase [Ruminococcus flavefaciens]|uniref:1-deoxy-D-xylulose-5-phosphate synthase n=1 Tax=Ruminococcus flavefaciens TaxID=1265 RepID=UPI0026F075FC|nr:1-deoxy-D-xylulose-5-phosphate synthase [Ruminococcus flavefaciens]MDD7517165.1 1-deoxy-D-xylulose-5-phosphate synthase [Ruminococcus flavefaciens]MDY5690081.1 1-deoxy-D-xylulose-5-phosphate synthase [Ruminococcus flavefaciens]
MKDNINENDKVTLEELDLPKDLKKLSLSQCSALCKEIRNILISTVSATGGHLASNLGAVELTMAIHRNFNSPDDKIVWDVGHQAYTHKILTGRLNRFSTLRQEGGISGFPKPEESVHDTFISGHSSTSVSVACGIAEAMKLQGKNNYTVAVIGDGAMTGGMFYEAMNNCGRDRQSNLIVILNDNNMSISKSVGSLSKYLTSLRNTEKYLHTKRAVERGLGKIPIVGNSVAKGIKNVKDSVKSNILEHSTLFEDMGFIYLGPVNGHSLSELEEVIHMAKSYHKPVFIHVKTVKGKGYMPAEQNPGEYHGISKFDIATGNPEVSAADSYSIVFGKELVRLADKDDKICAITAAMKYGTGLQFFHFKYPDRFFDVGIAEQHAVTFAGGLASMGMIPVFAVYSTFLQRAYDQLVHDVAIGKLHIVLGIDRAGIVGEDGETHQGLLDVPMLTTIPNTVIYSPSCYSEMKMCMKKAIYNETGLAAVRYPRGSEKVEFSEYHLTTEHLYIREDNSDTLIITYGRLYNEAYKAQQRLKKDGISCDILKLTKIYPLENDLGHDISKYKRIVFFEESMGEGSISEKIGDVLSELGYCGDYSRVTAEGFVKQASVRSCLEKLGLTREKMAEYIRGRCR